MTTPAERQRVLDTLGTMFGFPYRPYSPEEWNAAYQQEGIEPMTNQWRVYDTPTHVEHHKPDCPCPRCAPPQTELTDQGEQIILPGAERSARQAAASRDSVGHGKIRPRKAQKDPGGLFAFKKPEQPKLF